MINAENNTNENNYVGPPSGIRDFNAFKPGDSLDGYIIQHVYCTSVQSILFKSTNGVMCWRSNGDLTELQEYSQIRYTALETDLHRINNSKNRDRLSVKLELAFSAGFKSNKIDKKSIDSLFDDASNQIKRAIEDDYEVISSTNDYCLYVKKNGQFLLESPQHVKLQPELFHAFFKARALTNYCFQLLPKKEHKISSAHICEVLNHAFTPVSTDSGVMSIDEIDKLFSEVENFLNGRILANLRAKFFGYTLLCTVVISWLVSNLSLIDPLYTKAIYAALAGSFVSVLQRNSNLSLDPLSSSLGLVVNAISRIFIGVIFGVFTIMVAQSELALATFNDNPMSLIVFAFIAGFTERFAPDMMEHVSKNSVTEKNR